MTDASRFPRRGVRQSAEPQLGQSRPAPQARPGSRSANRRTTDSAASRRATNASTCAEDRSSHWTSSTRQTSGLLLRRVGQQAEHGQPDEKSIGLRARAQAKRRRERVALWRGQSFAAVQQSRAKLMQAGERKLHLPFHPDRAKDPTALARARRRTPAGPICRFPASPRSTNTRSAPGAHRASS